MNYATELVHERDNVLVFSGQDTPRALILELTREHLIAHHVHHLDVDDALADRPGLVARAWWAGAQVGFCGEAHPEAQPVTVVNLPHGMTESGVQE